MVPKVLAGASHILVPSVTFYVHTEGAVHQSIGKGPKILTFGRAALVPFAGQLMAGTDAPQAFVHPTTRISLLLIKSSGSKSNKLRVFRLFQTSPARLGQPGFDLLRPRRIDCLR